MPTGSAGRYARQAPFRSSLVGATGSEPSATIRTATAAGTSIENAFCRLKDFRRVATRYDKLAANFLSGVALATALAFWL